MLSRVKLWEGLDSLVLLAEIFDCLGLDGMSIGGVDCDQFVRAYARNLAWGWTLFSFACRYLNCVMASVIHF